MYKKEIPDCHPGLVPGWEWHTAFRHPEWSASEMKDPVNSCSAKAKNWLDPSSLRSSGWRSPKMTSRNDRGATGLFAAHDGSEVGTTQVRLFVEGGDDCGERLLASHHEIVNLFDNVCFGKLVVIASSLETLVIRVTPVKLHREFFHDGIKVACEIFSD